MVNYFFSSISTPKHKLHFLQLPDLRPADHTQHLLAEGAPKGAIGQAEPLQGTTAAPRDIKDGKWSLHLKKKKSLGTIKNTKKITGAAR